MPPKLVGAAGVRRGSLASGSGCGSPALAALRGSGLDAGFIAAAAEGFGAASRLSEGIPIVGLEGGRVLGVGVLEGGVLARPAAGLLAVLDARFGGLLRAEPLDREPLGPLPFGKGLDKGPDNGLVGGLPAGPGPGAGSGFGLLARELAPGRAGAPSAAGLVGSVGLVPGMVLGVAGPLLGAGVLPGAGVGVELSRGMFGLLANELSLEGPVGFGLLPAGLSVGGGKLGMPGGLPRMVPAANWVLAEESTGRGGGAAEFSSASVRTAAAATPEAVGRESGRAPGKRPGVRRFDSVPPDGFAASAAGLAGPVGNPELGGGAVVPLAMGFGRELGGPGFPLLFESPRARGLGRPDGPGAVPLAAADDRLLARLRSKLPGPVPVGSPGLPVAGFELLELGLGNCPGKPLGGAAGLGALRPLGAESLA